LSWVIYTWELILDRCESVYNRDRDRLRQIRDYYNSKIKITFDPKMQIKITFFSMTFANFV